MCSTQKDEMFKYVMADCTANTCQQSWSWNVCNLPQKSWEF